MLTSRIISLYFLISHLGLSCDDQGSAYKSRPLNIRNINFYIFGLKPNFLNIFSLIIFVFSDVLCFFCVLSFLNFTLLLIFYSLYDDLECRRRCLINETHFFWNFFFVCNILIFVTFTFSHQFRTNINQSPRSQRAPDKCCVEPSKDIVDRSFRDFIWYWPALTWGIEDKGAAWIKNIVLLIMFQFHLSLQIIFAKKKKSYPPTTLASPAIVGGNQNCNNEPLVGRFHGELLLSQHQQTWQTEIINHEKPIRGKPKPRKN